MPNMGVIKTLMADLPRVARVELRKQSFQAAEKMVETLQNAIRSQSLPYVTQSPLSRRYKGWKQHHGYDPRILIMSGEYVRHICVMRVTESNPISTHHGRKVIGPVIHVENVRDPNSKYVSYVVGLPDRKHPKSKLTYSQLARIHEYGSQKMNIPARPHWAPVWRDFRNAGHDRIIQAAVDAVMRQVRRDVRRANPAP